MHSLASTAAFLAFSSAFLTWQTTLSSSCCIPLTSPSRRRRSTERAELALVSSPMAARASPTFGRKRTIFDQSCIMFTSLHHLRLQVPLCPLRGVQQQPRLVQLARKHVGCKRKKQTVNYCPQGYESNHLSVWKALFLAAKKNPCGLMWCSRLTGVTSCLLIVRRQSPIDTPVIHIHTCRPQKVTSSPSFSFSLFAYDTI